MQTVDLTGQFLIAMPSMADPYFSKTLTYVCEHNEHGALGVIVNRPIELTLKGLFEQVDIALKEVPHWAEEPVYFGGPVQMDRGFVLHRPAGEWSSTLAISSNTGLTTSRDILEALASGSGPEQFIITLGYAGWAPGQLEHEISQNAWLSVSASIDMIFSLPWDERLPAAYRSLGIDHASLSEDVGHA